MANYSAVLKHIIPNFDERIQARNSIRRRCKDCIKELERGDTVYLLEPGTNTAFNHLSSKAEDHCVEADNLIKKYGRRLSPRGWDIDSNEDEIIEELEKAIEAIEWSNRKDRLHRLLLYIVVILLAAGVGGLVISVF
jgi:hypothetical protein